MNKHITRRLNDALSNIFLSLSPLPIIISSSALPLLAMLCCGRSSGIPRCAHLSQDDAKSQARNQFLVRLSDSEEFWAMRALYLAENGLILRARYQPGWRPSFLSTNISYHYCEDSIRLKVHLIELSVSHILIVFCIAFDSKHHRRGARRGTSSPQHSRH